MADPTASGSAAPAAPTPSAPDGGAPAGVMPPAAAPAAVPPPDIPPAPSPDPVANGVATPVQDHQQLQPTSVRPAGSSSLHHLLSPQSQAAEPAPMPKGPPQPLLLDAAPVDPTLLPPPPPPPLPGVPAYASMPESSRAPAVPAYASPVDGGIHYRSLPPPPISQPQVYGFPPGGQVGEDGLWFDPATGVRYAPPVPPVEGKPSLLDAHATAAEGSRSKSRSKRKSTGSQNHGAHAAPAPRKSRVSNGGPSVSATPPAPVASSSRSRGASTSSHVYAAPSPASSTAAPSRKKPRASAAAAAKAIAESQPSMYDSDLENDENAALVGSAIEAWTARRVERQSRIEEWYNADEKDRHQQQIDRTVGAHAQKIADIERRVAEAEAHRLREAARLKAIADEAARAQAERDRALADKKAKAAEARARYKAKAKEKARERKEEEDRRRQAEDDEERRVARERLKVRLSLNQNADGADLDDELADLDIVALAEPTGSERYSKKKSVKSRHSVAGLVNLPYAANGEPLPPGEGNGDDSDFSDFENFGLDEHRAGKRRKLEHSGDRRSRSANAEDEEIDELATTDDDGGQMVVDQQAPTRVGVEASGRKSRATGVGRGNWKRPPKLNEDGTPAMPKRKPVKGRQSEPSHSQEPQSYQPQYQHLPFQQSYEPPTPQQQQYDYAQSQHPASDDYPQQGQFDDPFSALPNHFQTGNGGPLGAYDYDAASSRGGSPQPTGPPMETEAEFAWRIEEARRKVWSVIAKKDVPRAYQVVVSSVNAKRREQKKLALVMAREGKRSIIRIQKAPKNIQLKAKKMNREMLMFWKRNEKDERENRKRAEKEALERAKKEEEERESKRQARKLNFLITQTELYSHFVGSKIKTAEAEQSADTASSGLPSLPNVPAAALIDGPSTGELQELDFNEDDENNLTAHARKNAQDAMMADRAKAAAFDKAAAEERRKNEAAAGGMDMDPDELNFQNPTMMDEKTVEQPKMLTATLKDYQLKGLTWLANLYEQGINGILADEMGLGKTIQSIALMGYLAEVHDIWGPFLVVAPASTLHNWQQEISRFVPQLKALPYWGNVKDRATLRKFWNRKQISYNKDAPFHVLVTSYQLVVTDEKYFQKVKWQYMILDEAQAIKSSSSTRWKTLLGFHCRNRLLLTGTPIQNSMQELWALLHFIMPSLFDSHDEFSEWFSRDIENAADKQGGSKYNEHQLRRLHMILKPFMLRRIKKHVQNELGDKIELDVYVDPSPIQRTMYKSLRANISMAELMDRATNDDQEGVQSLMNIVMQLRKVCNHPQLFDRADVKAPLSFGGFARTASIMREGDFLTCPDSARNPIEVTVPRLFEEDGGLLTVPSESSRAGSDTYNLQTLMSIWSVDHIARSLGQAGSAFSTLPLLGMSAGEAHAHVKRSPIQNLVFAAARNADRLRNAPYEFEPDFAASRVSSSYFQAHVAPKGVLLPASNGDPTLVPLGGAIEQAWSRSYLSHRSARFALPRAVAPPISSYSTSVSYMDRQQRTMYDQLSSKALFGLSPQDREDPKAVAALETVLPGLPLDGLVGRSSSQQLPRSNMSMPDINRLIFDSAKLARLDALLRELKAGGHRVLIFFQMTRMIDLLEEYLVYRSYRYLRLDGSSKIEDRRDMVTSWQSDPDLFVFLLSTRAGGLGINLTAADTVIFYDNDWNPSNDAQAMDRVHRLGQTKQVTVYRLITKGTIDERIVKLARQKKDVQDIVVGQKPVGEVVKTNEVLSLLMDDDELAESIARRERAEKEALNAPAPAAKKGRGKAKASITARPAAASISAFGASKDADEDDFFGGSKPAATQDDDDDDAPPAVEAPAPKKRKSKAKGVSKKKKHVDMEEI